MWNELLNWYDAHGRSLPWRVRSGTADAYRVWVSEVMLQQTRAETVIPYFLRFTQALPDIPALAAADEDGLYKLWEGLGYYSRARNLQRTARLLVSQGCRELPRDFDALMKLPGIGDYTAGAIASIAYGIPVPAVDGNVLRVFARVMGDARDILSPAVRRDIRSQAAALVPQDRPGDFNQALMDLGADVCIPGAHPRCALCPLRSGCTAAADGLAGLLPVRAPKPPRREEDLTVLVLRCRGRAALHRRAASGVLSGQWELPNLPGTLTHEELSVLPGTVSPLGRSVHRFTHLEWHMTGWLAELPSEIRELPSALSESPAELRWFTPEEIRTSVALPRAFRAYYAALVSEQTCLSPACIPHIIPNSVSKYKPPNE